MEKEPEQLPNGVNSYHTPSPSLNGLSLTEYTANPTPPREGRPKHDLSLVPLDYREKDGYPDVCFSLYAD
jgi:threonine dehydratase